MFAKSKDQRARSFSIRFVCQQGDLEIKSLLLAISLRKFVKFPHELIACIPGPESVWGSPGAATLDLFKRLGVSVRPIENPLGKNHLHANKFPACALPTELDKIVFLDSDIVCLRDFGDADCFSSDVAAKAGDAVRVISSDEEWRKIYSAAGHDMPTWRVETTVSRQLTPPWFNGGVLFFNRDVPLGQTWLDVARELQPHADLQQGKRRWSDMVSLAVALHRLRVDITSLGEEYNYPANFRPVYVENLPILCHYHGPHIVRREPILRDYVMQLLAQYPELAEMVEADPQWRTILPPYKVPPKVHWFSSKVSLTGPNLIITGIPRSGTSYLCNLLHKFDNCIALNEPRELVNRLATWPWATAAYLAETRLKILDGEPIPNKLKDGEVTEDTSISNDTVYYQPSIRSANFVLAAKLNRPVLSRLDLMLKVHGQDTRFVACVRNPVDTIASWVNSFSQLRDVDLAQPPVGGLSDSFLSPEDREELLSIDTVSDDAEKRARLWNYLARKILKHRDRLLIVNYDKLSLEPLQTIRWVLAGYDRGRLQKDIRGSAPRHRRAVLSERDWEVIFDLCAGTARELGVPIDQLHASRASRKVCAVR
jgi:hypothetical protein